MSSSWRSIARIALTLACFAAIGRAGVASAEGASGTTLPWGGSSRLLALPFESACAKVPIRLDVGGAPEIATLEPMYLGDPLAFGLSEAIEGVHRNRAQRARERIAWPDDAASATRLRAELVRGVAESGVFTAIDAGDDAAPCADTLYIHARPVIRVNLTGIAIQVDALLVRDGVEKPLFRDRIEVDAPTRALFAVRSKRERADILAALSAVEVEAWAAAAFAQAGDALGYDLAHGAAEPKSYARERYMLAVEAVTSSAVVRRTKELKYLRAKSSRLIVRPIWAKPA